MTEVHVDPEAGRLDSAAASAAQQRISDEDERSFSCLYFGYGSNLSARTVKQRCPDSLFIGLAKIRGWRWMINETGYANMVPGGADDEVYGSLCFLSGRDEAALDESEGVPWLYEKMNLKVTRIVTGNDSAASAGISVENWVEGAEVEATTYVDVQRTIDGKIEKEYTVWIRKAIEDATRCGMPMSYADKYLVKHLPSGAGPLADVMMVRTIQFGDKSGAMVPGGFASWSRG